MHDMFWWHFLESAIQFDREAEIAADANVALGDSTKKEKSEETSKRRHKRQLERQKRIGAMQESQKKMYARLSETYYRLFSRSLDWKDKDDFFWVRLKP
jgi:hypothetical protein